MYYEEKWIDNWLWFKTTPGGKWLRASENRMIQRLREALGVVAAVGLVPEHKTEDTEFLRGSLVAARGVALTALGR